MISLTDQARHSPQNLRYTTGMADTTDGTDEIDDALFWDVAEPFLADGAERSTMMGFPCLRLDGAFFASVDRHTGDLIVKLPAARVDELIEAGTAGPFAPNGRRFKEWASVSTRDEKLWNELMEDARAFAAG